MTTLSFDSLGLSPEVNQALNKMEFVNPSPIQAEAIPHLLEGKDLIGQAQTGTGKTAAFGIPIIEKIDVSNRQIQAVLVCPTRELAIQVAESFRKISQFKPGLTVVCVYGGQSIEKQRLALKKRPQILIGTPGRMLDFLRRNAFNFNSAKTIVLDEADEMLNMGFREDIEKIFDHMPTERQTVFFSATMPKAILELTRKYQQNPEWVRIEPEPAQVAQISQSFVTVHQKVKPNALIKLIDQYSINLGLVFCNTKRQVDFLVEHLRMEGYEAEGLHGGKAQNQRERILGRFRKGTVKILVATDVAARGIDVRNIQAVVNYDLPEDNDNYTHRIGRTGRAGQTGHAFSLVASHQVQQLKQLQKSQENAILRQTLEGIASFDHTQMDVKPERAKKTQQRSYKPRRRKSNALRKVL